MVQFKSAINGAAAMIGKPSDMTPVVDLTQGKGTGPVRYQRPDLP